MMKIFSIQDAVAGAFMRPFVAQSDGAAIREFQDIVNDKDHPVGAHPGDYTLFVLASFNELTGQVISTDPQSLGNGATFLLVHGEQASLSLEAVNDA